MSSKHRRFFFVLGVYSFGQGMCGIVIGIIIGIDVGVGVGVGV